MTGANALLGIDWSGKVKLSIALLAFLTFHAPLWAQEPRVADPPEYQLYKNNAGTWDAVIKMYFNGPAKPAIESRGVEVNEVVGGGKAARTTFKYKMKNMAFEGHGLIGYDPRSKECFGLWVDNFTTIPSQRRGHYDADKKTLTMTGVVVDGALNEIKQKQVTTYIDDETKTLTIYMVVEDGGKTSDVKLMEMTAKKRRADAQ